MSDLPSRLAAWRAARSAFTELQANVLFGVGRDTLQRIERGEVEPEPELAERILSTLDRYQPPFRHQSPGANGGAAVPVPDAGRTAGPRGAHPLGAAGVIHIPRPHFAIVNRDGAAARIDMHLDGDIFALSLDAARAVLADLGLMIALIDRPDLFGAGSSLSGTAPLSETGGDVSPAAAPGGAAVTGGPALSGHACTQGCCCNPARVEEPRR